jgi:hypothetical protein
MTANSLVLLSIILLIFTFSLRSSASATFNKLDNMTLLNETNLTNSIIPFLSNEVRINETSITINETVSKMEPPQADDFSYEK